MRAETTAPRARLSIDVEPELRRRVKVAAAQKDLSVREYLVAIVRRALEEEERESPEDESRRWAGVSARAFARDWESDEDRVYDQLS